ncbi:MAG: glycosyltransferase family 39 protein, partial [Candidatus Omnitrophica bacterium]|nr:glycosyltransferase family 39 protein [Candidatus Omnitrophota bacterium]
MKLKKQKVFELLCAEHGMIIFILAILLFHGLNNYIILTKSRYCFWPDTITYFERTEQVFQILKNVRIDLKSIYAMYYQIFNYSFRPPLIFITASPFLLFGMDRNIVTMSNLIYFAILLFATYGIGRKLYNYKVGAFSAFLLSMFPTVFSFSRIFGIDFGLAAMVTLTFYLFTLDKFSSPWFSLLTGVVIGLGSLSKESYFVFILPILFYFFFQKGGLKDKKVALNFVFLIITGLLIATAYYLRFSYIQQHFYHIFQCKTHISPYFYLRSILDRQLMPVFSLLLLLSLIRCFTKKEYWFLLMVLVPLVLFSLSPNKQDRFILPIFPYFAIIIAKFILSIPKHRRIITISLVLFSCLQYFIISYGSSIPFLRYYTHNFPSAFRKEEISDVGLSSIINDEDYINSS